MHGETRPYSAVRLLVAGLIASAGVTRPTLAGVISSHFNPTTGHTYYLIGGPSGEPITWSEAEAQAVALGGHLATINDAAENAWLVNAISDVNEVWIGLNDEAAEGTFVWISGEPVTYTNWWSGEPNDSPPGENYVELYCGTSGRSPHWNDYPESYTLFGLAEVRGSTRLLISGPFLTSFEADAVVWRAIHAFEGPQPAQDLVGFGPTFNTKPDTIVTGPDGLLYVAVFAEGRIDKLNPVSGEQAGFVTFAPPLQMPEFAQRGFTVLPNGMFLVVANEQGQIDLYDSNGTWLSVWRPADGQIIWGGLELTPNSTIAFVRGPGSYSQPNEIVEYSFSGEYLRTLIPTGAGKSIYSFVYTSDDDLLLGEGNGCIEGYNITASTVSAFACEGSAGALWITRDPITGSVFATCHLTGEVRGWSQEGEPLFGGLPLWDYDDGFEPPERFLYASRLITLTRCGNDSDCNGNLTSDDCDIAHDCCQTGHEAGCSYGPIESCVCEADRYCCLVEWDEICVERAASAECGPCDIDCNDNAVPDECDIAEGTSQDCQPDRIPDECQSAGNDCDSNGAPDECEPNFDGDALIDSCDPDIDNDGVLNEADECDNTPLGRAVDAGGRPLGDIDEDCDTDMEDYALFLSGFTGPLP